MSTFAVVLQLPDSTGSSFTGPDLLLWLVIPILFVVIVAVVLYWIYARLQSDRSKNPSVEISDEVEKQKEQLLALAEQKKAAREAREEADEEQKELQEKKEKLLEETDPEDYWGELCPITGVELFRGDRIAVWVEEERAYARPAVRDLKQQLPVGETATLVYFPDREVEIYTQEGKP